MEYILIRLIQTLVPLRVPLKISPEPPEAIGWPLSIPRTEDGRVYVAGSIILVLHMSMNSRKHSLKQ